MALGVLVGLLSEGRGLGVAGGGAGLGGFVLPFQAWLCVVRAVCSRLVSLL